MLENRNEFQIIKMNLRIIVQYEGNMKISLQRKDTTKGLKIQRKRKCGAFRARKKPPKRTTPYASAARIFLFLRLLLFGRFLLIGELVAQLLDAVMCPVILALDGILRCMGTHLLTELVLPRGS